MKDSPQLHWPCPSLVIHPSCRCLCCEKLEDIETEKGSMLDSTKMNEIMSKCLAAGQAERYVQLTFWIIEILVSLLNYLYNLVRLWLHCLPLSIDMAKDLNWARHSCKNCCCILTLPGRQQARKHLRRRPLKLPTLENPWECLVLTHHKLPGQLHTEKLTHENLETSQEHCHFSLTVAKIQTSSMSSKTWALQEVCIRSRHCIWSKRRGGRFPTDFVQLFLLFIHCSCSCCFVLFLDLLERRVFGRNVLIVESFLYIAQCSHWHYAHSFRSPCACATNPRSRN